MVECVSVTRPCKAPKGMTAALDKRNFYLYAPKGYTNNLQCLVGFDNHVRILKKAGIKKSVFTNYIRLLKRNQDKKVFFL